MHALYRMRNSLPSLILTLLLPACGESVPPPSVSDVELEALQEAEVLRHSIEEQELERQRVEAVLGVGQNSAR